MGCTVGVEVIIDVMHLFFWIRCIENNTPHSQWGHLVIQSVDRPSMEFRWEHGELLAQNNSHLPKLMWRPEVSLLACKIFRGLDTTLGPAKAPSL